MASVQLSVLRDGQWVLETTYVSNVLGKKQAQPIPKQREAPKVPRCGLLTRTVVESPIFHWTLPARIRCLRLNDVAFIGVRWPFFSSVIMAVVTIGL